MHKLVGWRVIDVFRGRDKSHVVPTHGHHDDGVVYTVPVHARELVDRHGTVSDSQVQNSLRRPFRWPEHAEDEETDGILLLVANEED